MARITKVFDAFGVQYRSRQFSAVDGFAAIEPDVDLHPTELFAHTEAFYSGEWHSLRERDNINLFVTDYAGILPPCIVLRGITAIVRDLNFKFMTTWKGVPVPGRFISDGKTVASKYVPHVIAQLVQDGAASMRELEEYYSLEDAFKMFDIITSKCVNQALANEALTKK